MFDACKPRSRRYPVSRPAMLKAADGHRMVTVINASRRGLGLRGRNLPTRGEYVEVRMPDRVVVGRVAWSAGTRCGIQTQDTVELGALTQAPVEVDPGEAAKAAAGARIAGRRSGERQALVLEESRSNGRLLQFGFLGALVLAAGVLAAEAVQSALSAPLQTAHASLARGER